MTACDAEPFGLAHGKHEGIDIYKVRELGFWLYLCSDAVIFSLLFATYCIMVGNTAGAASGSRVFELPTAFFETVALLASTFTFGLVTLSAARGERRLTIGWLVATFVLGGVFVGFELSEFVRLIEMGAGPGKSGFLSAYFTLVATHGLHVSAGLVWITVMVAQIMIRGLTEPVVSRLARLGLFWRFLDLIWIGIFSIVYLPGVL